MAKSLRSKVKRAFRSKKRKSGIYAATEAARLDRLNARLLQITKTDTTHVAEGKGGGEGDSGWFACARGAVKRVDGISEFVVNTFEHERDNKLKGLSEDASRGVAISAPHLSILPSSRCSTIEHIYYEFTQKVQTQRRTQYTLEFSKRPKGFADSWNGRIKV